jgi:hypothetical protein
MEWILKRIQLIIMIIDYLFHYYGAVTSEEFGRGLENECNAIVEATITKLNVYSRHVH